VLNVKVEAVEESDLASMEFCFYQFVSDCVHDEQRTFIGSVISISCEASKDMEVVVVAQTVASDVQG
ncbi:hypothetical protein Tco_1182273, partial [Tanacetum coccineum]